MVHQEGEGDHHPDPTPGHGQGPDQGQGGVGTRALTHAVGAGTERQGDMYTADPGHPRVYQKAGHDHAVTLQKVLGLARMNTFS